MARRLPEDPVKRRLQQFKRLYQHMEHWRVLIESGDMNHIITVPETGEEIYLLDLMVGIESLPPRQREAFELICLLGYTETDATRKMLPHSKWSTPIQQYADTALARMVAAYDASQDGTYIKTVYIKKGSKPVEGLTDNPSGGKNATRKPRHRTEDATASERD
jgi:hypothetical protein